jgi:hypothetical protein
MTLTTQARVGFVHGASEDPPGVDELAAFIVSSVKNEIVELLSGAGFEAEGLIDEATLLRIAKDEIKKAFAPTAQAVIDRAREDITSGLNA